MAVRPRPKISRRRGLYFACAALAACGCATLDTPGPGTCGNRIAEPGAGEFCDGSEHCVPAGGANACHFTCDEAECPDALVCGEDEVCRAPGPGFGEATPLVSGRTVWLEFHDFDHDGRDELVLLQSETGTSEGTLRVLTLSATGLIESEWTWPGTVSTPVLGDATGDGLDDILLRYGDVRWPDVPTDGAPNVRTFVLENRGAPGFAPMNSSTGWARRNQWTDATSAPGWGALLLYDGTLATPNGEVLATADEYPSLNHVLPAIEPVLGTDHGSCFAPRMAFLAGSAGEEPAGPVVVTRPLAAPDEGPPCDPVTLGLPPGVSDYATGRMFWLDVDADGAIDLVAEIVTSQARAYVAYGIPGTDEFQSTPPSSGLTSDLAFSGESIFDGLAPAFGDRILAMGHFNEDMVPDAATTHGVAYSRDCALMECYDSCGPDHVCAYWDPFEAVAAEFADLDGDGKDEVVAISSDPDEPLRVVTEADSVPLESLTALPVGEAARSLAVTHLDPDGRPEIVVTTVGSDGTGSVSVAWSGTTDTEVVADGIALRQGIATEAPGLGVGIGSAFRLMIPVGVESTSADVGEMWLGRNGERRLVPLIDNPLGIGECGSNLSPGFAFGCEHTIDRLALGNFSSQGAASLLAMSASPESMIWELRLSPHASGTVAISTAEGPELGPEPGGPALMVDAQLAIADFDGDALDEVLSFATDAGFTSVRFVEPDVYANLDTIAGVVVEASWPNSDRPSRVYVDDLDGDGDPDVFLAATDLQDPSRSMGLIFEGNGGTSSVAGLDDGFDTWAFSGVEILGGRAVATRGAEAFSGGFDVTTGEFTQDDRFDLVAPATWSSVGDVNRDGLPDFAMASSLGVSLHYGLPGPPVSD